MTVFAFLTGKFSKQQNIELNVLSTEAKDAPISTQPPPVTPPLQTVVENAMSDATGKYAIAIKNLKTGEAYHQNEHETYDTGSLYKLWVMSVAYEQIKKGDLAEDEVLSQDVAILNQKFGISAGDAELTDGTIALTVNEAITQMISISHNYASLLLSERVKNSALSQFLQKEDLKESRINPPKTTAADLAIFFEKLYQGKLVDAESSNKMQEILKKQELNDGIPKYLPKEIKVAHKTGDIDWSKHDAGIVYAPKGDYIFIMLSESDSPSGAQERIALVSQAVYQYFNK